MRNVVPEVFQAPVSNPQLRRHCFFAITFLLFSLTFPSVLQAQFTYIITTNLTVNITGYTGAGGSVIVPSTITGFPVTTIESQTFQYNQSITDVWIPNTVSNLGSRAFLACVALVAINVDTSNQYFSSAGGVLFDKTQTQLIEYPAGKAGSYIVPDNVVDIGLRAFEQCPGLTSVSVPKSVTNIETTAFYGCRLTNAMVGAVNIGDSAFYACNYLANLTISNSVTDIGASAFAYCTSLASPVIPDSVTNLGSFAFSQCWVLTNVTIGRGVTTIGSSTFQYCNKLTSIAIPNSITNIADSAFDSSGLTSITVPDSVIYLSGFSGCAALTNVTMGKGVTTIGNLAFAGCTSLTNVTMGESVTTVDYLAFAGCTGLTHLQVGNSVENIGERAFQDCTNLTGVIVSKSVTNLGQYAFNNCTSLSGVYFEGPPPVADSTVFSGNSISIIYYLPSTPGWSPIFANRPAIPWFPQIVTGDSNFGLRNNSFGFNVFYARDMDVVVEGSTNLAKSVWVPLATNILTTSSFYFADPQSTNFPGRFYRVHSPL